MAAHLAAAGLAAGEALAAVAAGVFLILLEGTMAGICQLQVCGCVALSEVTHLHFYTQSSYLINCSSEPDTKRLRL